MRFKAGTAVATLALIYKDNKNVRIQNPDRFMGRSLPIGTLGRIHSSDGMRCLIWFLEEFSYNTVMIEIPFDFIGLYVEPHEHKLFPHLG